MAGFALDEDILERMRDSGCYSVTMAIESGVPRVVNRLMAKPLRLEKVPGIIQSIRKLGMEAKGFFMLGYPGETRAEIEQTVRFAKALELDWTYFFITSPLPGTRLWDICAKEGYIETKDFDPTRSFYESIIRTPEFNPEYLQELREKAIIDMNFKNNPNLIKYDVERAIDSIGLVAKLYPHFVFANYFLAKAYEKKGDNAHALEYYRRAQKIDPQYEAVAEDIKRMAAVVTQAAKIQPLPQHRHESAHDAGEIPLSPYN
jgi:radical SAM superfamily enzyme YgiQ (UPF0313 family)